jgi:hypothetical protein
MYDITDPVAPVYHDGVFGGALGSGQTFLEMYSENG